MAKNVADEMTPFAFQDLLNNRHIIISDLNLQKISCNRRGLLTLNSLKEIVNIEGTISLYLYIICYLNQI
jgi:hypothetical protein